MGFEALQDTIPDWAFEDLTEMIGGPKKEGQTQNIRFADKADEGGHVAAIDVDPSSTRLLEACFLLAQYASWINDHAMPAFCPVAHELTHVNERSR